MTSRREFLFSSAAFSVGAPLTHVAAGEAERPHAVFGIISDTHVTGPESAAELAKAFRFFRKAGADAVLHCGDITNLGYRAELEAFLDVWKRTMPHETALVAALGNRDLSATKRMSAEVKARDHEKLLCSDSEAALRMLGMQGFGIRGVKVKGVPVIAADWKHEGELEAFLDAHSEMRDATRPMIVIQHPHPANTVFSDPLRGDGAKDARETCILKMFPKAVSFSGHSHRPFAAGGSYWRGEFAASAAGSYYLGPSNSVGGREVALLTVMNDCTKIDRYDLRSGFHDAHVLYFDEPADAAGEGFTFVQWNLGHFAHGKSPLTSISRECADALAARYSAFAASMGADVMGLCEFSPQFDLGGSSARERVFGSYGSFEAGPCDGFQCNAVATKSAPLRVCRTYDYSQRTQKTYALICETQAGGRPLTVVETHLDLDEASRKAQRAELLDILAGAERVVLSGDFNVSSASEFHPYVRAGFSIANTGDFGSFPTHRRRNPDFTPAIDNVMVKGLTIRSVRMADAALEFSDHRPLVCRLA